MDCHLEQPHEVLVLGAGFSRAVSPHLPLADALGQRALERATAADPGLFQGSGRPADDYPFEVWLSLLAENQPHLDEGANRKNAAQFAKLADAVVAVLSESQERALADKALPWLYELLSVLHERRSTVITFNYDTLIEVGINSMDIGTRELPPLSHQLYDAASGAPDLHAGPQVTPNDVLRGQPPLPAMGARWAGPLHPTLRLLKLHGSLDWWWVPQDQSGATLAREETRSTFGHPVAVSREDRNLELPGREAFIVPPLAVKSRYYANPVTRQLWHDAYAALCHAERITLVGYSLPQTDIVTGGLLAAGLRESSAQLEIVDPSADEVATRLQVLGGPGDLSGRLHRFAGSQCIEQYVRQLRDLQSSETVERIAALRSSHRPESPDPAIVLWSQEGSPVVHTVSALKRDAAGAVILATEKGLIYDSDTSGRRPTTNDVVSSMDGTTRLMVHSPDGQEAAIVGFTTTNFDDPNARHVLYLIPAGQLAQ